MSLLLLVPILATSVAAEGGFTLSQPGQFVVEKVAGDELAHDIYSIAIDARGRVHVSGPGYIRRLVDADADGRFDAVKTFFAGPTSGCQGMVFHERALFATGGDGLLRFDDSDEDGAADGPPVVLLRLS
ncbi:MAG TPA: hypothetical protein VFD71_07150, partial [Planctomycetota bacterium]|nr:hypothetical protein [Planctomycetota bacterium]